MGIQNGPAPEGRATGATDRMTTLTMERDSLQVQLQESEQLRTEAFAACETMRQELAKVTQELNAVTQERDEWRAAVEYQQQQAAQLRQQVEALEASVDQEQGRANRLQRWAADLQAQLDAAKNEASKTGWVVVGSPLPDREQLDAEIVRLTNNWGREIDERKALQQQVAELQAQIETLTSTLVLPSEVSDSGHRIHAQHAREQRDVLQRQVTELRQQLADKQRQSQVLMKERDDRTAQLQSAIDELRRVQLQVKDLTTARDAAFKEIRELRQHRDELQSQLEAAAVTPQQQPDGTAERLETVREVINAVLGWYVCTEYLGEANHAVVWEQVGALIGHLKAEVG